MKRKVFWLILLIGVFTYFPSLFGGFIWDDEDFVFANQYVQNHNFDKFYTSQAIAGRLKASNYYRPIQESSYSLLHLVFGFNPFIFHLFSIIVHIFAAYFIFLFVFELLSRVSENKQKTTIFSFVVTLIFLLHPLQTETVSYISGVSDSLTALWGFLSLYFFLRFQKSSSKKLYFLSLASFILSVLSKEIGLAFLGSLGLIGILFSSKKSFFSGVKLTILELIPYSLCAGIYLFIHFTFINELNITQVWDSSPYQNYAHSILIRLLTFIQNLFTYISIIFFPKDLFMERDFTTHIQTSLLNPYLLLFTVATILIGFLLYRLRQHHYFPILCFSFLSFFGSFLPLSGIVLINGIFYEHFLYIPLVFFTLFVSTLSMILLEKRIKVTKPVKAIFITLLICISSILLVRSWLRQAEWNDPIRFYTQTLEHAPTSVRIHNNLAIAYAEKGDLDQAIIEYQKGIQLDPTVPNFYHNLGNAYLAKGNYNDAEKNYLKAIELNPQFFFSYQKLLELYSATNQKDKFSSFLERTKKQFPNLQIN